MTNPPPEAVTPTRYCELCNTALIDIEYCNSSLTTDGVVCLDGCKPSERENIASPSEIIERNKDHLKYALDQYSTSRSFDQPGDNDYLWMAEAAQDAIDMAQRVIELEAKLDRRDSVELSPDFECFICAIETYQTVNGHYICLSCLNEELKQRAIELPSAEEG